MFRAHALIFGRAKIVLYVSGIITPIGGRPVHRLRENCSMGICSKANGNMQSCDNRNNISSETGMLLEGKYGV